MVKNTATKTDFLKTLSWVLVVGSILGILASAALTLDKIKILENPNFVPACSINPIISCGSVMKSSQSHVFGFDNPLIGLALYGGTLAIGVALLAGGRF